MLSKNQQKKEAKLRARAQAKAAAAQAKVKAEAEAQIRAEAEAERQRVAEEEARRERAIRWRAVDAELQRFRGVRARNEALERSILDNPFDQDRWAVFVDWLQSQGDIRGELAVRDLCPEHQRSKFGISKNEIWARFEQDLWDSFGARFPNCMSLRDNDFHWHCGFIRSATLRRSMAASMADLLNSLFASWCGRFVRTLFLVDDRPGDGVREPVVQALAACPTLSSLYWSRGQEWASDLEQLFDAVPSLQTLELGEDAPLQGTARNLTQLLINPHRESLFPLRCLRASHFPALQLLELRASQHTAAFAHALAELLQRDELPQLRHLKILGVGANHLGLAFQMPAIQRLELLDISLQSEGEVSAFVHVAHPLAITPARVRIWMRGPIGPNALRSIRAAVPRFEQWDGGSSTAPPNNTTPWWG